MLTKSYRIFIEESYPFCTWFAPDDFDYMEPYRKVMESLFGIK